MWTTIIGLFKGSILPWVLVGGSSLIGWHYYNAYQQEQAHSLVYKQTILSIENVTKELTDYNTNIDELMTEMVTLRESVNADLASQKTSLNELISINKNVQEWANEKLPNEILDIIR